MARDYKHVPKGKVSPKRGHEWPLFALGLGIGLFVALIVFLKQYSPAFVEQPVVQESSGSVDTRTVQKDTSDPLPPPPKPRFDFYTILPEMEVKVPDWEIGEAGQAQEKPLQPGIYVIQVGSFRNLDEADRVKAQLASMGIQAEIQRVVMNGQDTWHRVRIGPFKHLARLDEMRERLLANDLDFMMLRMKTEDETRFSDWRD